MIFRSFHRFAPVAVALIAAASSPISAAPLTEDSSSRASLGVFEDGLYRVVGEFSASTSRSCGSPEDIPVPGNYFSSSPGKTAVYNPSFGVWRVCGSSAGLNRAWGMPGDIPAPGDFTGNGFTDFTVFRPSTGEWYILGNTGGLGDGPVSVVSFGLVGDSPAPADYDGDGTDDIAVFRQDPASGGARWLLRYSGGGEDDISFGLLGDLPVAADFSGDGSAQLAVFRPSEAAWYIRQPGGDVLRRQFGLTGDIPSPADIDEDGIADLIVYRPSVAQFFIQSSGSLGEAVSPVGSVGAKVANDSRAAVVDFPAALDANGDRTSDLAVVRTAADGQLQFFFDSINGSAQPQPFLTLGAVGDTVVLADYDGDGASDPAVAQISGDFLVWRLLRSSEQRGGRKELLVSYGLATDDALPADYDGDGKADLAVIRNQADNSKLWLPNNSGSLPIAPVSWGFSTDRHFAADFDGDRRSDYVVLRVQGSELLWLVRTAAGEALAPKLFGFSTDEPIVGDFNGDGRAEVGVIRIVNGFRLVIVDGIAPFIWGIESDRTVAANYTGRRRLDIAVWREVNGQGFFFVRGLGAATLPFGVVGDTPVDGRTPLTTDGDNGDSPNDGTSGDNNTGNGVRLNCTAGSSSVANQAGGFVWKPVSEGDGNLVVLFSASRAGSIRRAALVDRQAASDVVLETLRYVGNTNGGRPTFRANRPGRNYPSNLILVRQGTDNSVHCITVPSPGQRYD